MKIALLATAALAVLSTAMVTPADARMHAVGCTSENMAKAYNMSETMAYDQQKLAMVKELAGINAAFSSGDMRTCAMHMNNAMRIGTMKPAPVMGM